MKQIYFIYHCKKVHLIIFAIIINGHSKQPSEMELHTSNDIFLIPWQFTVSLSLYLFNLTLSKIKPSYSNLLLITFAIIINGQLKQPSKMELHIWKWPIITAVSRGVKLDLILGMMIYQVIISFFIFQKYWYWKILEVSVFKYVFEIRSISISIWKYKY